VFDDAGRALDEALERARPRFPRALLTNGASQLRAFTGAVWE